MSTKLQQAIADCSDLETAAAKIVEQAEHMEDISWDQMPGGHEHAEWERFLATLPTGKVSDSALRADALEDTTGNELITIQPEREEETTKVEALAVLREAISHTHPENPAVQQTLNVWVQIFEQTTTYPPPALLSSAQLASVEQSRSPIWRYRKLHIAVTLIFAIAAIVFATLWFAKQRVGDAVESDLNKKFNAVSLTDRTFVVKGDINRSLLFKASNFEEPSWVELASGSMNASVPGSFEAIKRVLPRDGHNEDGHFFVIVALDFEGYLKFRQGEEEVTIVIEKDFANSYLKAVREHENQIRDQLEGMLQYIKQGSNRTPEQFRGTLGWLQATEEWKKREEGKIVDLQAKIAESKTARTPTNSKVVDNDIWFLERQIRVHKVARERLERFERKMKAEIESLAKQAEANIKANSKMHD